MSASSPRSGRAKFIGLAIALLLLLAGGIAGAVYHQQLWDAYQGLVADNSLGTDPATPPGEGYPGAMPLGPPESGEVSAELPGDGYPRMMPLGPPEPDHGHSHQSHDEDDHAGHAHEDHHADEHDEHAGHSHDGDASHDDHDSASHAAHDANMLVLSGAAEKNLGILPITVGRDTFSVTDSMPGFVTERPGRTHFNIPAPTTGIVTEVMVVPGEAVQPGRPMFRLRLTHEDLVDAQANLLQTVESLDVVRQEIGRLESLSQGVIAQKEVLTQKYEQQKLQAILKAQRQRLELHGLSTEQVDQIVERRELLREIVIEAPRREDDEPVPYHLHSLDVNTGQFVSIGESLGALGDFRTLYIEGLAFEDDAADLIDADRNGWPVTAVFGSSGQGERKISDLKIVYLSDEVDRDSRALSFFVELPNDLIAPAERAGASGPNFLVWRYRPGQQVELRVPVERAEDQLIVPVEAIAGDGAETYVFKRHTDSHGTHYDRVAVHVVRRNQRVAVLDPDGPIKAGDTIAGRGAYQMHLAMKNATGGGIDPHAGHSH